ncbi:metal ABC transporter substrate-binding protein [Leucobacter luti]|uniref:Zinc/manganese transport system substrate-binding protein/manganese/iron transport system substrate-binding protein n=1 Tax=Leucobacter luti TaxID=340320 RepID=A0A4Q7U0Y1_9MICO|nr:metal ABC transporter substrate-binding protein [Leucobacter luti]MBL3699393.1 zinc ABC transporter substrate-binding protein [Leucobacter luti]RZT66903.1 zinc/manganese transport system substrate-binding protein/manganese/iron transport system substrate-binding protein [Leucobacter luti]
MSLTPRGARRSQSALVGGIALAAAAALTLTGCAPGASADGAPDGALSVVTTTTQLTDFAREVGGDDIELRGLLVPGGSAHHFDPTPADLLALSEADVLVVNGAGLETFIDDAIDASGFAGEIVTASDGIDLAEATEITAEGEAGESGDAHADHDHAAATDEHADEEVHADETEEAGHDHAEGEDEHDHDHGATNPHLWTSPRYAEGMVSHLGAELARIDPDHAAGYEERTAAYTAKLEALDAWVGEQFAAVPEAKRVLVSGHDSLRYFLHDYDIAFAGAILPSFEDNAEPSAADIDALVAEIRERGVTAVFVESSMSPKLARTIAAEAGVTVVDAESIYADSLGTEDSGADTYIDATIHNTRLILEAWGETAAPLPATLK